MEVNFNSLIEIVNNFKDGVKTYVDERIKNAPFTKVYTGRVVDATEFGYRVLYNNKIYDSVPTIGGICTINETVRLVIPDNNMNNMFILKASTNKDIINVQNEINRLQAEKLDKIGNSSDTTVTFTGYTDRQNINSGEKLSVLFGKIYRWLADLKTLAFTGNATDVNQDSTHRFITDTERTTWNNASPTPHDSTDITYGIGNTEKFGHVKLSDNYTTANGGATAGSGASDLGLYSLYLYMEGKYLNENKTLYVSPTGNDVTGNGSSGSPYLTINKAISVLPKNLGSYKATIRITDGTYNEVVDISNFYNGEIAVERRTTIALNTLCNISNITVNNCSKVTLRGLNLISDSATAISIKNSGYVYIYRCQAVITQTSTLTYAFWFENSNGDVGGCRTTGYFCAIYASELSRVLSSGWSSSSGTTYGLYASSGSHIYLSGNNQPSLPYSYDSGSIITSTYGTQISALKNTGLTCSWGTLAGGYYENGNSGSESVLTIELSVNTTQTLVAGTEYNIMGFPVSEDNIRCAVSTNCASITRDCIIYVYAGVISFTPDININSGTTIYFNCTYIV